MKISGFAQLRNELEKNNLLNWFRCMEAVCDNLFIYDQNSTDGSIEEYKRHPETHVIESPINDFVNEIRCKAELLEFLLQKSPDTNWVFWMDGDTLLERKGLHGHLRDVCEKYWGDTCTSLILGHYNLWRSDVFYRVDTQFHFLHERGVYALWKNDGNLGFQIQPGLHKHQFPVDPRKGKRVDLSLIHRGFATDESIIRKYQNYKSLGRLAPRLINEKKLTVKRLPDILPEWFKPTDTVNPTTKQKITC